MPDKVFIFDTTLRDGEQSPGCSMNLAEKLQMARQLDRLGVDILEGGFPIASHGDYEAVKAISAEIRRPIIAALPPALTRLDGNDVLAPHLPNIRVEWRLTQESSRRRSAEVSVGRKTRPPTG